MPPGAHQWPVNPGAIEVRPHIPKTLCSEPRCPHASEYQVTFSGQDPITYCPRHARAKLRLAIGKPVRLDKALAATMERDGQVRRTGKHHIHWPAGGQIEGMEQTMRRDMSICGVYLALKYMAQEEPEITCPTCKRKNGLVRGR